MRAPRQLFFVAVALLAACNGSVPASNGSSQSAALTVYRDGCSAEACGARPEPRYRCAGGYPMTVCTKARGSCSWQIDCVDEPPPDYDGNVSVASCNGPSGSAEEACGPLPTYDEKDCVYGFIGEPQCESYGGASCAWSHRCRPQPCDQRGTCNTLDRSKLGAACDAQNPCPEGSTCGTIYVNLGETVPPTCIAGNPCDALTCKTGRCFVAESYPVQVRCGQ